MKTQAYVQFTAKRQSRDGKVLCISPRSVSLGRPKSPLPGAFVLKLELEIPEEVFLEQTVKVEIPEELLAPNATCVGLSGESSEEQEEENGDDDS